MMGGEDYEVTLLCENRLMNSIVDRFGRKILLVTIDNDHFTITVKIDLSNTNKMKKHTPEQLNALKNS